MFVIVVLDNAYGYALVYVGWGWKCLCGNVGGIKEDK